MTEQPASRELSSWKEIAAYLGASERAAQLWEHQRGLPVRRLPGPGRGRVLAYTSEIDAWKRSAEPAKPLPSKAFPWHRIAIGITATLVILLTVVLLRKPTSPATVRMDKDVLIAHDREGNELWRRVFPNKTETDRYPEAILADLDGDDSPETIVAYRREGDDELLCLDARGKTRWRYKPGRAIRSQSRTFENRFGIQSYTAARMGSEGRMRIVVNGHHGVFSPAQISLLDEHGRLLREYWHPGHLNDVSVADLDGDGAAELYFAGINNNRGAATLVVLDPDSFNGSAADQQGRPHFPDLPVSPELGRVLMPRTSLNRFCFAYNAPTWLRVQDNMIRIDINENPPTAPAGPVVVYHLSPELRIKDVIFSDTFVSAYGNCKSFRLQSYIYFQCR